MRLPDAVRRTRALVVTLVATLTICAIAATPAAAGYYAWTLSGGGDSGAGYLTTGAADNGGFDITSFTGEIDGIAITGLLGGQPGAGQAYSPSGAFIYDNILYPSSNSAQGDLLDTGGILFSIAGGEANIWAISSGPGGYGYYYSNAAGSYPIQDNAATFTAVDPPTTVPEPAPAGLLVAGIVALWGMRRRRPGACNAIIAGSGATNIAVTNWAAAPLPAFARLAGAQSTS